MDDTHDPQISLRLRICVTNAFSPIGLAIISALDKNFPQHHVRAGIAHDETMRQMDNAILPKQTDVVALNPSKRQSLIWSLVGVDSLLLVPSHDVRLHTTLSYIAAAKAAGVKLITVVSCPTRNAQGVLSYSNTPDAVERAVLKSKLGCCFVRLPFLLDAQEQHHNGKYNASIPLSACVMSGVGGHESPSASRVASISLIDVGCACASILANYKQHMFTRYDLFIRPSPSSSGSPSPSCSPLEDSIAGPSKSKCQSPACNKSIPNFNSPFPLPTSPGAIAPGVVSNTYPTTPTRTIREATSSASPSLSPLASEPFSSRSASASRCASGSESGVDSGLSSGSSSESGSAPNSAKGSPTSDIACHTTPKHHPSPAHVEHATYITCPVR